MMHARTVKEMQPWLARCAAILVAGRVAAGRSPVAAAASMDARSLPEIQAATLELVAAKPVHNRLN